METIGTRRAVILAALLGLNILIAAAVYLWIIPQQDYNTTKASALKSKVSASRANVVQMTTQFDTIQKLKEGFEKLQNAGLFATQDRSDARDRIRAIQKYSRVLTASYDIKPAVVDDSGEKLKSAQQVILSTPIDISIEAIDDTDIYSFANLIKNGFPGYVSINSVELTRNHELDESALHGIGSGTPPAMITGKISFTWNTIADQKDIKSDDPAKAGI